jgi:hypothetical protein
MRTMNCVDKKWQNDFDNILQKAIIYLDKRMEESYNELLIRSKIDSTLFGEYKPSMEEYIICMHEVFILKLNCLKMQQKYFNITMIR